MIPSELSVAPCPNLGIDRVSLADVARTLVLFGNPPSGAALADIITRVKDPESLKAFENALAESYEAATDPKKRTALGLVASSYAESHKEGLHHPAFLTRSLLTRITSCPT